MKLANYHQLQKTNGTLALVTTNNLATLAHMTDAELLRGGYEPLSVRVSWRNHHQWEEAAAAPDQPERKFVLEMRNGGDWFKIWSSDDGADTASYMKSAVELENRHGVEYRMVYRS